VRNDLEKPAAHLCPELAGIRQAIEKSGASSVSMSGSGSCFWAFYPSEETWDIGTGPLTKSLKFYIVSRVQGVPG
jgi:4-diphosphocytidyl-2C-methyl-D-erythritol kinase